MVMMIEIIERRKSSDVGSYAALGRETDGSPTGHETNGLRVALGYQESRNGGNEATGRIVRGEGDERKSECRTSTISMWLRIHPVELVILCENTLQVEPRPHE